MPPPVDRGAGVCTPPLLGPGVCVGFGAFWCVLSVAFWCSVGLLHLVVHTATPFSPSLLIHLLPHELRPRPQHNKYLPCLSPDAPQTSTPSQLRMYNIDLTNNSNIVLDYNSRITLILHCNPLYTSYSPRQTYTHHRTTASSPSRTPQGQHLDDLENRNLLD